MLLPEQRRPVAIDSATRAELQRLNSLVLGTCSAVLECSLIRLSWPDGVIRKRTSHSRLGANSFDFFVGLRGYRWNCAGDNVVVPS